MYDVTEFPFPVLADDSPFAIETIKTRDGVPINVYATPRDSGVDTLVVVNAIGLPCRFLEPLARALRTRYRVISWDARFLPGIGIGDFAETGVQEHVDDLELVFEAERVERATVVGYCSGAEVALQGSLKLADRIDRIVLMNGNFSLRERKLTKMGTMIQSMVTQIVRSPAKAAFFQRLLNGEGVAEPNDSQSIDPTSLAGIDDPKLLEIIEFPYKQDVEKYFRLATMYDRFSRNDMEAWIHEVTVPCVAVHTPNDTTSHPDQTLRVSELLRACELVTLPNVGHYGLYDSDAVHQLLLGH